MDEIVVSTTQIYETLTVDESVIVIEQHGEIEVIEPFSVVEVVEVGQQVPPNDSGILPVIVTEVSSLDGGRFSIDGEPSGGLIHDMAIITDSNGISYEVLGVRVEQDSHGYFGVLSENDQTLLTEFGVDSATATFSYLSLGA